MRQKPPGTLSHGHSRCAGTCSARLSCRQNKACPRCVSCRGTGTQAHLQETSLGKCRRFGTAFSEDAESRAWS